MKSSEPEKTTEAPQEAGATKNDDSFHAGHAFVAMDSIAKDYHVPMSPQAIENWVDAHDKMGIGHSDSVKAFTDYVKPMAQGLYPTLAPQIQQGLSVSTLLEPYKMVAKSLLGPETEPDFTQPHWNKALTGHVDDKTGRPAPLSMESWRQLLTTDPVYGYGNTEAARKNTESVLDELHALFHTPGGPQ